MKLRNFALITLTAAAIIGLGGCSTMSCSNSKAYQDGKDDGMTPGSELNKAYGEACSPGKRPALLSAYTKGYQAGLPQRAQVSKETKQMLNSNGN